MKDSLWPYSKLSAFIAIPVTWVVFTILFVLMRKYTNWSDLGSQKFISFIPFIISLLPIGMILLDAISSRGGVVDIKGVKLDFSKVDLNLPEVRRESIKLPDNIGIPGHIVPDSSPMKIIETLRQATSHEIVVIDLKDGNAWWITRLLALSEGAARAGFPKAFVFIGKKENVEHQFLGWAFPRDILKAILKSKEEYEKRYIKAIRIAKQVVLYGNNELLPNLVNSGPSAQKITSVFQLNNEVARYTHGEYANLGEEVTEQILMDQLSLCPPDDTTPNLEDPPHQLTLGKLEDMFGHCLHKKNIDIKLSGKEQISHLLNMKARYIPLVRDGVYESIVSRRDVEQLVVREMFQIFMQLKKEQKERP